MLSITIVIGGTRPEHSGKTTAFRPVRHHEQGLSPPGQHLDDWSQALKD